MKILTLIKHFLLFFDIELFYKVKKMTVLPLFLLMTTSLFAQQDSTFPIINFDLLPNPCFLPKIESHSEIKTLANTKVVYLKFEEDTPSFFSIINQSGTEVGLTTLSAREIIFEINNLSDEVDIRLLNSCGEMVLTKLSLGIATTEEKDFIEVSPEMGKLLQKFAKQKDAPLLAYLSNDETVHFFEKLEFYQKYGLKNTKMDFDFPAYTFDSFETEEKEEVTWGRLQTNKEEGDLRDDECFCDFISITRRHSHFAELAGGVLGWYDYMKQKVIKNTPPITVGDKGEYWVDLQALGASKWLGIQTQGWKRNKVHSLQKHYESGDTTQTNSGKRGTISILLLCMDREDLPESCSCDKRGTFYYRYDSDVYAEATLLSGGGYPSKKKAKAAASDAGMAYCYFGDAHAEDGANIENFIPIEGIQIGVKAECKGEINEDFWPGIETLGNSAIDIFTNDEGNLFSWDYEYSYDSTLIRIDTLQNPPLILDSIFRVDTVLVDSTRNFLASEESVKYKNLLSNILSVFTTPYLQEFDCTGGHKEATMAGEFNFNLAPNVPATFVVMTYAKVIAAGRRSWHSIGNLASEYSMAVVISPGKTSGQETDCCTPWVAGYLVGAPFITYDSKIQQYDIGEILHGWGFSVGEPNGLEPGLSGYLVRGQRGQMSRPAASGECKVPLIINLSADAEGNAWEESEGNTRHKLEFNENIADLVEKGGKIAVYDLSGKYLGGFELSESLPNPMHSITNHIKRNLTKNIDLGIYIIRLENAQGVAYFKTLIK